MTRKMIALALAAIMAAMLIPAIVSADDGWTMYVYTDNGKWLNVRRDPMTGDNVIGTLNYGTEVRVRMTTSNGWACIEWPKGSGGVGYVMSRYLVTSRPGGNQSGGSGSGGSSGSGSVDYAKEFSAMNSEFKSAKRIMSPYTIQVRPARASGFVNLRWAPSTESERIATCRQNKELVVLAELNNWYQVQDPETGMIGFIMRKYTTVR